MNELYHEFQQIQEARSDMDGLEKTMDQLNLRNLEMKEQMLSYKEKYEDMLQLYQEMEECIKTTLTEKDNNEKEFKEELNKKNMERAVLENTVTSLENKMNIILEDLNRSKDELNELAQTLSEFYTKENEYKLSLDTLYRENVELNEKYTKFEEQKSNELTQVNILLDKAKSALETLETERNKVQEEFDTLNQTLNYNVNELEEKKTLLAEAQGKVRGFITRKC